MFKHILTYVELGQEHSWKHSLPKAIEMAEACDAELHILTCAPDFGMALVEQFFPSDFDNNKVTQEVLKNLENFIAEKVPSSIKAQAIVGEGKVRDRILDVAERIHADLILLSPAREKSSFNTLGATAAHVVRHAKCSTLIVRGS